MDATQVLGQLEKLGKPTTVKIYARHGVTGPCCGVAYGDLRPLARKIGRNQPMASALWRSGLHDARVLATMIADPQAMTRAEVERWLADCSNYILADAVAGIAAQMPGALEMARDWIGKDGEWVTSAGWMVYAVNGATHGLTERDAAGLLDRIEQGIHSQPNRTRYAMNNVLIGIGGYVESLRPRALAVAKAIGTVEVDHGETGCKTPDAAAYIAKVSAYKAGKSGAAGTRAKAPARRTRVTGANARSGDVTPRRTRRTAKTGTRDQGPRD